MALNLGALDEDLPDEKATVSDGKPLRAPVDMFYEDPDQPRKERDTEADNRDREDIKRRGVLQAITVCPPDSDGRMKIRFGARRWRLSCEAGKKDIPYVIQEDDKVFDDYAQVAENERRKNLSPLDLATFIAKRIKKGDKKNFIAENIGIDASEVTAHLVLVDGPEYIRNLYTEGKCRTPKYLYELSNLAKDHPEKVELFCAESESFDRRTINAFIDSVKKPAVNTNSDSTKLDLDNPRLSGGGGGSSSDGGNGGGSGSSSEAEGTAGEGANSEGSAGQGNPGEEGKSKHEIPSHNPNNEKNGTPKDTDPSKLKKPLMIATYGKRDVMVQLFRRPTTPGLIWITFEDTGADEEVETGKLKNWTLTESHKA